MVGRTYSLPTIPLIAKTIDVRWGRGPQLRSPRLPDRKAGMDLMKPLARVTFIWFHGCFSPQEGEKETTAMTAQSSDGKEGTVKSRGWGPERRLGQLSTHVVYGKPAPCLVNCNQASSPSLSLAPGCGCGCGCPANSFSSGSVSLALHETGGELRFRGVEEPPQGHTAVGAGLRFQA